MSDDGDETLDALRAAQSEARSTLDHQLATFDDMDQKAMSILRVDATLASVLVTLLSLAGGTDLQVAAFVNPYVGAAVAAFVGSAVAAALTYTATAQVVGIDSAALDDATGLALPVFHQRLLAGYADWIRFNRETNVRKAPLLTSAILGLIAGVVLLSLGALAALATVTLPVVLAGGGVLVVAAYASGLHRQLQRLREPSDEPGTVTTEVLDGEKFDGQLTFNGDGVSERDGTRE